MSGRDAGRHETQGDTAATAANAQVGSSRDGVRKTARQRQSAKAVVSLCCPCVTQPPESSQGVVAQSGRNVRQRHARGMATSHATQRGYRGAVRRGAMAAAQRRSGGRAQRRRARVGAP